MRNELMNSDVDYRSLICHVSSLSEQLKIKMQLKLRLVLPCSLPLKIIIFNKTNQQKIAKIVSVCFCSNNDPYINVLIRNGAIFEAEKQTIHCSKICLYRTTDLTIWITYHVFKKKTLWNPNMKIVLCFWYIVAVKLLLNSNANRLCFYMRDLHHLEEVPD